ncbi:MAG TPA: glutaredoxin [Candidatus Acidoferrales bacterium]|nr:glutaredoxin [Candidatus Acidoferrales bacterium]
MEGEQQKNIIIYTLPVCPNCHVLRQFLMKNNVSFNECDLDSPKSRTTLLMNGIFTTTAPVLQVDDRFLTYDQLFEGEKVKIDLIMSIVKS